MPTPLVSNPFGSDPSSQPYLAYKKCCDLESLASTDRALQRSSPPGLVAARLLGHLLVLSKNGRQTLAQEITDASGNAVLVDLAKFYITHFVKVFKRASGRTPAPTEHPSRPSFEDERNALASINDAASLNHGKAKAAALRRDNYRCPLTGLYDLKSVRSELVKLPAGVDEGDEGGYTEAAHIIPESTNHRIDESTAKAHQSAGVWQVLSMFSSKPEELHEKLNGNEIHRLENILTLEQGVHTAFDDLSLWFELVANSPNKYTIQTRSGSRKLAGRPLPETITFTTTDQRLRVPSRYYLELHALCCEITRLSGAGDYVDLVEDKLKGMGVLARDGSSSELLSFAISSVLVH